MTTHDHKDLAAALRAARLDARPIVKDCEGGKRRPTGYDREENHWYFARTERVMEEAERLLSEHGLEIEWEDTDVNEHRLVVTRWALVHPASGQRKPYRWTAPIAPVESPTLGVGWTTRNAQRWVTLLVLQIQLLEEARPGDIVERGFVVRRAASPADVEAAELDKLVGPPPGWMSGEVAEVEVGGLRPPPLLPGDESEEAVGPAEQDRRREFGAMVDALTEDPDADAAARGEVVDVPDAAQLYRASQAWRGREGKSEADLRSAAGAPPPGKPLTDDDRRKLRVFLEREGCWT
jgi:hypothetical protein